MGPKTNSARVADIYRLHGTNAVTVSKDTSADEIVRTLAKRPAHIGMFLVDSDGKYLGMITRRDLTKWTHLNLNGGRGSNMPVSEAFRLLDARKAMDLAAPYSASMSVSETDTVEKALETMIDYEQDVLPVVNRDGRVIGDIELFEVLCWVFVNGWRQNEKAPGTACLGRD